MTVTLRRVAAALALSLCATLTLAAPAAAQPTVFVPITTPAAVTLPRHAIVDLATGRALPESARTAQMHSCAAGSICFYDYWSTGSVSYDQWAANVVSPICTNLTVGMRDRTSYIWNNSGARFEVYIDGIGCGGAHGTIWRNSDGNMTFPFDNNIDSFKWVCWC